MLNPIGVNVDPRAAGTRAAHLGARTLSSDPDWRFVNVRRLMLMIEKAHRRSRTQWAVFEPNDVGDARASCACRSTAFLRHALASAAHAGRRDAPKRRSSSSATRRTTRPTTAANGRLIAEVGVAPVVPFEFVVLRVGAAGNELEIAETTASLRRAH